MAFAPVFILCLLGSGARADCPYGADDKWIVICEQKRPQRAFCFEGRRKVREVKISSRKPGLGISPEGVFPITRAEENHYSRAYRVMMPYSLFFVESRGIALHATAPNLYPMLGKPASHGCVRQSLSDARWLYHWALEGATFYSSGKKGVFRLGQSPEREVIYARTYAGLGKIAPFALALIGDE